MLPRGYLAQEFIPRHRNTQMYHIRNLKGRVEPELLGQLRQLYDYFLKEFETEMEVFREYK